MTMRRPAKSDRLDDTSTLARLRLPEAADPVELDRLIARLGALVELRATPENVDRARDLLGDIESRVQAALESPAKHRDWRTERPDVLRLLTDLDKLLYRQPSNEEQPISE